MRIYEDSSVYLRVLLGQPGAMTLPAGAAISTSAVTRAEARRLLFRLRDKSKLSDTELQDKLAALDAALGNAAIIPNDAAILDAASAPLPTPLGVLDAIHLVSALRARDTHGDPLHLATHNVELAIAARACKLEVICT